VYYYLVSALKRRLILELQDSFSKHPVYEKAVPYIQSKYSFKERPQFGIVVKGSSANKVALSADNFIGVVQSHVMLAYCGAPAYPLEWVREDLEAVRANGGHFPLMPGIYYLEVLTAPTSAGEGGTFAIDPLITVTDEPVAQFVTGTEHELQLKGDPTPGTLRLWDNNQYLLREGVDYVMGATPGAIHLLATHVPGGTIIADYRYAAPSIGPVDFNWNTADFKTLPGVVLAFGKRAKAGDKVAIVVYPNRVDTANAFGGKFEISFDFDVIATDPIQMEEMADFAVMSLWGEKKSALEFEGIEVMDISMGGESEEAYDETADLFFYMASLSIQMRADWEVHIPMPLTLSRVTPSTAEGDKAAPPGSYGPSTIKEVYSGLFYQTAPIAVGRNHAFERIG
jgi:hypothetical protein